MTEARLHADRLLTVGLLDEAERLYRQALDAGPGDVAAMVGLARVALERGDERSAHRLAREALAVDPGDSPARRMEARLAEVLAARGIAVSGSGAASMPTQRAASVTAPPAPARTLDAATAAAPGRARGWQPAKMPSPPPSGSAERVPGPGDTTPTDSTRAPAMGGPDSAHGAHPAPGETNATRPALLRRLLGR